MTLEKIFKKIKSFDVYLQLWVELHLSWEFFNHRSFFTFCLLNHFWEIVHFRKGRVLVPLIPPWLRRCLQHHTFTDNAVFDFQSTEFTI